MTATLAAALVAAQAEMPAVEKDAVNPHFRSKFTSLDHLIAKTRPVLTKHGLAITQWPTSVDGQPALRTKVTHTSGESDEDVMLLLLGKQDMQGLGGAITYGKRYMWAAVCAVSTDEDDDGNLASNGSSSSEPAPGRQDAAAPLTGSQAAASAFPHPDGQLRTDAQAKMLHGLYTRLSAAGAIGEEAFCNHAAQGGAQGTTAQACCETITKAGASELISKLKVLEKNVQAAA